MLNEGRRLARRVAIGERAAEGLREAEQRFSSVFRACPVPIAIVRQRDGMLLDVNPAWERVLGYARAEVCGQPVSALALWVNPGDEATLVATLVAQGFVRDLECKLRRKDGQVRECSLAVEQVDTHGEACLLSIILDITARKQQDEQLRISEWNYRALAQNYPNGAVLLYDHDLRYTLADGAGLAAVGLSKLLLEGRTIWEAFPHETAAMIEPTYRAALAGESSQVEVPYAGRVYLQHALPIRDERDVIIGGMISTQDITIIKQIEQERAARRVAEDAGNRQHNLLARMSHELRTPLNAILGFGQLLETDDLNPDQRESVEFIVAAGKNLLELVDGILGVVSVGRDQFDLTARPVQLNESLYQALATLQPPAQEKRLKIAVNVPDAIVVLADPLHLGEVFAQLLSNAVKFNRLDGSVSVAAHDTADQMVRVEIADSGPGLSAPQLALLFTPSERLGAESAGIAGVGTGLVLAQQLVAIMHGHIGVHSKPGVGSTFWLELPGPGH